MQFRTQIPIPKSNFPIDYDSKIMSIGSCFAENMGKKFDYFKFQNLVNPFGIIFNSKSIERIIERIVNLEFFTENDIFYHNNLWHCFEVHSELNHPEKVEFIDNLNNLLQFAHNQIKELTHLVITYGTSWVYSNTATNNIVANCHKVPQKHFTKELLSLNETQKSIENTIQLVHSINKRVEFIFTLSPVRHIKDGFIENNVSKAVLLQSVYQTVNLEHLKSSTFYFPSFEIIQDELRDYRFYEPDMLHPNQTAIDYVWQKFAESAIVENNFLIMNQVDNIQKMILHKSFNPESTQNQEFKIKIQEKIEQLRLKNPNINF